MDSWQKILRYLSPRLRQALETLPPHTRAQAQDIRVRAGAPLSVSLPQGDCRLAMTVTAAEVQECFVRLCGQAVHTHQAQLAQGFVTTADGVRVGIAGTAVVQDGAVTSYRQITSLCIRITRRFDGCAVPILPYIETADGLHSALLCGAPASGKTTLLRDIALQLANRGRRVSVADERAELASGGLPLCDVLDGCPKAIGILQAVRTLSPDVVIADELGDKRELQAVAHSTLCGVPVIASVHAYSSADLSARASLRQLLQNGSFDWLIWLRGRREPGQAAHIVRVRDWLEGNRIAVNRVLLHGSGTGSGAGAAQTGEIVAGVDGAFAGTTHLASLYGGTGAATAREIGDR